MQLQSYISKIPETVDTIVANDWSRIPDNWRYLLASGRNNIGDLVSGGVQ